MGVPIGSLLGMAMGGIIADHCGWRIAFLVAGAPGILVGLAVLIVPFLVVQVRSGLHPALADGGETVATESPASWLTPAKRPAMGVAVPASPPPAQNAVGEERAEAAADKEAEALDRAAAMQEGSGGKLGNVTPLRKGDMLTDFYDGFRDMHGAVRGRLQHDVAAMQRLVEAAQAAGVKSEEIKRLAEHVAARKTALS